MSLYGIVDQSFNLEKCTNENIEYKGKLDLINSNDDYEKLRKEDVFVFPTKWAGEGFAGALIDAMALGKPIIATRHNMNEQIVDEGKNGLLFPPGDVETLEILIEKFYDDRELVETFGRESLLKSKDYDANEVMKKVFGEWM